MKIALYGSSLLSCYWNGAATYYRGLLKALAVFGHQISFYEPDILDRQRYRDIAPPDWCEVVVYPATYSGLCAVVAQASRADVVIKASGVVLPTIGCWPRLWRRRGKMRYVSGGTSMHRRRWPKSAMMHLIRYALLSPS